ncbi:DNA mismatch endonuclease Vsr [bacterium]|nr:DNA mismatch endonuclease Vsr [bacterium]
MVDVHTKEQRHRNMSAIKSKNTQPEIFVRKLLHNMGYRYRLHVAALPGKPDIVFRRRKKVIFVHGCYWHMHDCKYGRVVPTTRTEFWQKKRMTNVSRDTTNIKALEEKGWKVLVVWECQLSGKIELQHRLTDFLGKTRI